MKRLDSEKSRRLDYSAPIGVLEEYYDRQYDLIKKGNTDLVTLELMMLGRTLGFISLAKNRLGVDLNTEESSVEKFEEVVDAVKRGVVQDELFSDASGGIAASMSAYLGFLIIANIGGKWEDTENGAAVEVNGREVYVYEYIEKRLLGLLETDAVSYYSSIRTVGQ